MCDVYLAQAHLFLKSTLVREDTGSVPIFLVSLGPGITNDYGDKAISHPTSVFSFYNLSETLLLKVIERSPNATRGCSTLPIKGLSTEEIPPLQALQFSITSCSSHFPRCSLQHPFRVLIHDPRFPRLFSPLLSHMGN